MQFNHYGGEAAHLAAALVNTPDKAFTPEQLEPLLGARGIVDRSLTVQQATELAAWRRKLTPCFGGHELHTRCHRINDLLEEASSRPHISLHDGYPHLHYSSLGADAAAHIQAVTAAGLAYVVCFAGATRLGTCARAACGRAYVDTSRNGRRTYCSVRCANNDAVARHRDHRRHAH